MNMIGLRLRYLSNSLTRSSMATIARKKFNSAFSSRYLLITNVTLSTVSSCGGDLLAQHYEILTGEQTELSKSRNLKVSFTGTLVGPMFHYWYLFLDRTFPGRTARLIFTKVFLDMTVAPPINIFIYIGSLGIMDGDDWVRIRRDMIVKGKDLWAAEWMVWPFASAIAFYVLPTKFRVLFESSLSLIVDGYYSYVRYRDTKRKPDSVCGQLENDSARSGNNKNEELSDCIRDKRRTSFETTDSNDKQRTMFETSNVSDKAKYMYKTKNSSDKQKFTSETADLSSKRRTTSETTNFNLSDTVKTVYKTMNLPDKLRNIMYNTMDSSSKARMCKEMNANDKLRALYETKDMCDDQITVYETKDSDFSSFADDNDENDQAARANVRMRSTEFNSLKLTSVTDFAGAGVL